MLVFLLTSTPVVAQITPGVSEPTIPLAPRSIGVWSDWEAFTSQEAGTTMCTLVSRPFSVVPAVNERGDLALTVARWPGRPDAIRLTANSVEIGGAKGELRMGAKAFPLETGPDGAFMRNGAVVVEEMKRALQAVANFEGPQGRRATVTYSLRGFRAAYGATRRVCPER